MDKLTLTVIAVRQPRRALSVSTKTTAIWCASCALESGTAAASCCLASRTSYSCGWCWYCGEELDYEELNPV